MNEKKLDNKKENSILSMYENVKKINSFKDLILENNEQVFKEFSKYDNQILNIKNELNILQGNLVQTQTNTLNDIKVLEDKLNNNYTNINTAMKDEINETIKRIIAQIEQDKKINESLVSTAISKLNVDGIKNSISTLRKENNEKISELEHNIEKSINELNETNKAYFITDIENTKKNLEQQIDNLKEINQKFIVSNIEDIKVNISNIKSNTFDKIEDLKTNISSIENNTFNKIAELDQEFRNIIKEDKEENQSIFINAIKNLNIDDIKNNISNIETINAGNIEKLKLDFEKYIEQNNNAVKEKIEELNYFDTVRNLENSLLEVKEIALNNEYSSKVISKKVEELDSLNQKKLDKVRKEQEKFIINRVSELDNTNELNNIKNDLEKITQKIQDVEILSKQIQIDSLSQMKDYLEKRILKMRYASTIQTLTKHISELRRKVDLLETAQNDEDTIKENIELILSKKLKEQENKLISNINSIINKKLNEEQHQVKKHINSEVKQILKEYNSSTYIESIVEEKIKETIKKQKAKKTSQMALAQKQQEYIDSIRIKDEKNVIKTKKTSYPSIQRTNNEIINSIYNTKKSKSKNSLDDMVATLNNVPNTKTNKTKKSITTLAKTVKKSQILNFDN